MRILVCGAAGFIGKHCVRQLLKDGFDVVGLARNISVPQQQMPELEWRRGDFSRLRGVSDWTEILGGIDAVVNCVGVLQEGRGESLDDAHVHGPRALYRACEQLNIARVVHISAMGIKDGVTAYDQSKLAGEQILTGRNLDWVILRPGLVIAPDAYGGTALMRAFASLPGIVLVPQGTFSLLTVAVDDLAKIVSKCIRTYETKRIVEVATPDIWGLPGLMTGLRGWMGLKPAQVITIPKTLVGLALKIGDLAGWLGWPSGFRSASLRQIEKGVTGPVPENGVIEDVKLKSFSQTLASYPVSSVNLRAARFYILHPVVLVSLAVFWVASGVIALGPGFELATNQFQQIGLSTFWSLLVITATALLDIMIGMFILVRRWSKKALISALVVSSVYLVGGSILEPALWMDPLGPMLKVIPATILTLVALALSGSR